MNAREVFQLHFHAPAVVLRITRQVIVKRDHDFIVSLAQGKAKRSIAQRDSLICHLRCGKTFKVSTRKDQCTIGVDSNSTDPADGNLLRLHLAGKQRRLGPGDRDD